MDGQRGYREALVDSWAMALVRAEQDHSIIHIQASSKVAPPPPLDRPLHPRLGQARVLCCGFEYEYAR